MIIQSPAAAIVAPIHHDWPRFWISQTGILDLSDAGFLRDPTDGGSGVHTLRTLEELEAVPALALLGEPGIGKSTCLAAEHKRRVTAGGRAGESALYVDLRVSSSEDALHRRIFASREVKSWEGDASRLTLYLDSLDEALLRIDTIANMLADELPRLPTDRLSVRVACRTAVWPAKTLGKALSSVWSMDDLQILELAPLRRRDVVGTLSAHGISADDFVPKLFGAQAVPFAIKPLTLKMLVSLYKRDGRLPNSTADLYRQACLALCEERNDSRRDAGRHGRLNAHQRMRLAGRMAAATLLGRCPAVWTGPEAEVPVGDVPLSALVGATEVGSFPTFSASNDDIREVLDTGLFTSRGEARMGWAHQSYGEYLAALYLCERQVPAETTLRIVTHPSGGLFPPLAIVGAWAASLSPELRTTLITTDPWTLLRGDLADWTAGDREALTTSLLAYVERGSFFDYFIGIGDAYGRLAYPGLVEQLRTVVNDRSLKSVTRRIAITIAEQCGLRELEHDLWQAACDRSEDPMVRAAAMAALRRCGGDAIPTKMLVLLKTALGEDPKHEIRGYALDLLWPDHADASVLFGDLVVSPDDGFYGSYWRFLSDLPDTLATKDLVPALGWATASVLRDDPLGRFNEKTLADAIMFRAWDDIDHPDLIAPFLLHVRTRLRQHGDLVHGTDVKAQKRFAARLEGELSRRRTLLLEALRAAINLHEAHYFKHSGFLRSLDFAWLLEISPAGSLPVDGLDDSTLCNLIWVLFNMEDEEQFELLYPALGRWPRLREQFAFLVDGVLLTSSAAVQQRALQASRRDSEQRRVRPVVLEHSAKVEELLRRAEGGEWQAWWQLNHTLVQNANGRLRSDLNYVITSLPGWMLADESQRSRIVATAGRYVVEAETSADLWVGKRSMSLQHSDLAALRAFVLLHELAEEAYARIPATTWARWTSVIVGLPREHGTDKHCYLRPIVRDNLRKAPTAFCATVKGIIQTEINESRAAAAPGQETSPHFFLLGTLRDCWDDDGLKATILQATEAPDIKPTEYAALLEPLLAVGYAPALEHGLARLASLDMEWSVLADVMLSCVPDQAWPILRPIFEKNDELARAVLLRASAPALFATPFFVTIDEEAIADLYLMMLRLFPPENDAESASGIVSPLDTVPHLRDGAVRHLASVGTEQAVRALRRLVVERPSVALLPFELSRAEIAMRLRTWSPLTVKEILFVSDRTSSQLITSAADLLGVLLKVIRKYEDQLHGAQTPVRDLWDRQGATKLYRPIDENGFSDNVTRFLRSELGGVGIFANREVEVSRKPGAPIGMRTDILVNASRHGPNGEIVDQIAAVIEVKGSWNDELLTSLQDQLLSDYMVRLGAPVGIYLVGAFDPASWDTSDSRRSKAQKLSLTELRGRLDLQAAAAPEAFRVRAVVIPISTPGE